MHKVVIVTFNRSNEMFFMHELKLIQDRREALRRQEDEILANENAHHSRAEMEHRKKIINNFGTDSSVWRSTDERVSPVRTNSLPWRSEIFEFWKNLSKKIVSRLNWLHILWAGISAKMSRILQLRKFQKPRADIFFQNSKILTKRNPYSERHNFHISDVVEIEANKHGLFHTFAVSQFIIVRQFAKLLSELSDKT